MKQSKENRKPYPDSLNRNVTRGYFFHIGLLLEEHRNQMLSEAKSEVNMQESRAESSDHRNQEYEASRREQAWLHAELQNRDRAQREMDRIKNYSTNEGIERNLLL